MKSSTFSSFVFSSDSQLGSLTFFWVLKHILPVLPLSYPTVRNVAQGVESEVMGPWHIETMFSRVHLRESAVWLDGRTSVYLNLRNGTPVPQPRLPTIQMCVIDQVMLGNSIVHV